MSSQAFTNYVQVGRAVLLRGGEHDQKVAFIVEIIDHNRALVDGPTTGVPRHVASFRNLVLTKALIPKLPRGVRHGTLKKFIEKSNPLEKFNETSLAQKIEARSKRVNLSDFDRFKVMRIKKNKNILLRKQVKVLAKQSA
ncbi:60S ribosomal protein L14 [Neoconidiobolus thromboides FSU 785]|nr:60S ribosomal protein L14 [Neoconidiobolus thromboides FSU 785]